MSEVMQTGEWWHSIDHDEPCRVVDAYTLWGQATCLVWLPRRETTVRVLQKRLASLKSCESHLLDRLSYVSAAARISDSLERDALVAPLEGTVIPLPHQLLTLQRAISGDRIRYLLADEVGLGKTIEAGLILRELKIRGLVKRILVVAPAGLVLQWQSEMKSHFNEDFRLILPGSLSALRQAGAIDENENLWRMHHQVICPLDSVKPIDSRRGWSQEQLARYNRERFEDLVSAGWDLIIIDEAHRIGGSTEQVARFKLGDALSQAAPYLLLLSATPHQGKSDAFRRLIRFLDPDALPGDDAISREAVAPFIIRTEKRRAIDTEGKPNVGVTADERGERVHVFSDALLRSNVAAKYAGTIEWPNVGLPEDYFALIAPALGAFIGEGRRTVAHGGVCLEEVVVPFVTLARLH
jgi:hypothetical protein